MVSENGLGGINLKRMIIYDNGNIKTAFFFCRSSVKIYLCKINLEINRFNKTYWTIMMKRFLKIAFSLMLLANALSVLAQSMTDTQVLEYVKQAMQQGMGQEEIAVQLLSRGVTEEQALRVKEMYQQQMGTTATSSESESVISTSRLRQIQEKAQKENAVQLGTNVSLSSSGQTNNGVVNLLGDTLSFRRYNPEDEVFGRNIFNTASLTFEPNINLATPENYRLGPGDEIIIDIWGASQNTIKQEISPDGFINIPNLGLVYLGNKTMKEADGLLKEELRKIYADSGNSIKVTLGNIRTIQVNVMGEVMFPGTYTLSSFSTVFHALYSAGGVSPIGSLRNVKVARGGSVVATLDVYEYIMKGKIEDDICLQEGDVIIVPAYEALVKITGKVKRPMRYEMKKNESVGTLLAYAGGFASDAYKKTLRVIRQDGSEYSVATVDENNYTNFQVQDGDAVTVDPILDRYTNRLEIKGAVYRPGIYQLSGNLNTVRQLVEKADGLLGEAFTARAVLYRERENLTREVQPVDVVGILNGTVPDIALRKNDILYIPSIHDLQDWGKVTISGEINKPGEYTYADNMTLEDLVITAGGLKEAASIVRVDIARRIRDPKSTTESETTGENYSFALKDGFVIDGQPGFVLQPYDQVIVRRSPSYSEQVNVTVNGEVLYSGQYNLRTKNERLSSVIERAGGVSKFAYVRGAKLTRVANAEELKRMEDAIRMIRKEIGDAVATSMGLTVDSTFTVGIDLEAALANPGSDADIVLREGDVINVPEYNNTVKISGAVMMPNTVSFLQGKKVSYYLSQAGGYSSQAKKSKKFIIYMNGQVAEVKGSGKKQIEPGCEIVVPNKTRKFNFATMMSNATSFASLATMVASLANLLK